MLTHSHTSTALRRVPALFIILTSTAYHRIEYVKIEIVRLLDIITLKHFRLSALCRYIPCLMG
jgi:hypothetical protein